MVTTAAGLIIGIPALVMYNWLSGRAEGIIFELEVYATKVLDTLRERQRRRLERAQTDPLPTGRR